MKGKGEKRGRGERVRQLLRQKGQYGTAIK